MPKLYKKDSFKDNCGFGLIANLQGRPSRKIVIDSIEALKSMTHRGGIGSDGKTGDGCGLMLNINKDFFIKTIKDEQNINLSNRFAIGQLFYFEDFQLVKSKIKKILNEEGLKLVTKRDVPINKDILGHIALDCIPNIYQIFIESNNNMSDEEFETALLQSRKFIEEIHLNDEKLYFCSFSSKTIIYKGLMLPSDIENFYIDLQSKRYT